jgi:hypothetical protein
VTRYVVNSRILWAELVLVIILLILAISITILLSPTVTNYHAVRNIGSDFHVTAIDSFFHPNNFVSKTETPLPEVAVNISDKSLSLLLSDIPKTLKYWQKGSFEWEQNQFKAKIRIAGDSNPSNYLYKRKAFKVKLRKGVKFLAQRRFSLIPMDGDQLIERLFSYLLADSLGLIAPLYLPVNLKVNQKLLGSYLLREDLGEEFLRSRNILPGEIYKGDRSPTLNKALSTDFPPRYFTTTENWTKQARNNRQAEYDWSPLRLGISELWQNIDRSQSRQPASWPEEFWNNSAWSTYAAYEFLVGGSHQDSDHNQRLLYDDQLGQILPILWDLDINECDAYDSFFPFYNPVTSSKLNIPEFREAYFQILSQLYSELQLTNCLFSWMCLSTSNTPRNNLTPPLTDITNVDELQHFLRNLIPRSYINNRLMEISNRFDQLAKSEANLRTKFLANEDCLQISTSRLAGFRKIDFFSGLDHVSSTDNSQVLDKLFPQVVGNTCSVNNKSLQCLLRQVATSIIPSTIVLKHPGQKIDRAEFTPVIGATFSILNQHQDGAIECPTEISTPNLVAKTQKDTPVILNGRVIFEENKFFSRPVKILPGSELLLGDGASVVFLKGVIADGTKEAPISVIRNASNTQAWGVFAILGPDSDDSSLKHITFSGGSVAKAGLINFLGMVSVHNTRNLLIDSAVFESNQVADDALHLVYTDNVQLRNTVFRNLNADAIDVDLSSNLMLTNITVIDAKNDCLDFMGSYATLSEVHLSRCGDKGISIGERSLVSIADSSIDFSKTGIAVKDSSLAFYKNVRFFNNIENTVEERKNDKYRHPGKLFPMDNKLIIEIDKKFQLSPRRTRPLECAKTSPLKITASHLNGSATWFPPHNFRYDTNCVF